MTFTADAYGLRILDFVDKIGNCATFEEVKECVINEFKTFGFDFVTVWSIPGVGKEFEDTLILNTRPSDYIEHYQLFNYV